MNQKTSDHSKMKDGRRNFLKLIGIGGIGFAGSNIAPEYVTTDNGKTYVYNIKNFGAIGDGKTINSKAIQNAIDKCSANGGGQVYVPPGTFLTGTIYLRTNVLLYLENGSVLLGSPNRKDYNNDGVAPYFKGEDVRLDNNDYPACHLIYATYAKNVGIIGDGVIDGNNKAFWGTEQETTDLRRWKRKLTDWRPNNMLAFNECENVKLCNVTATNSTISIIWINACKNVKIVGVNLLNDRFVPNGDGLNIINCKDVLIDNCIIHTADDAIGLFTMTGGRVTELNYEKKTENIVVSNCVISTPCAAIRLGPNGDGPITNCVFSNIRIENSHRGIYFSMWDVSKLPGFRNTRYGPQIENISFNNIIIDANYPIIMHVDNEQSTFPACVKNVKINNIIAQARICCIIESNKLVPFENIQISDVNLRIGKDMIIDRGANPEHLSVAFLLRNTSDVTLRDINIEFEQTKTRRFSEAIKIDNCQSLKLENINVKLLAMEN
jgi:polygalacturonase